LRTVRLVESDPAGELAAIDPVIFGGYLAGLRDESYHVEPDRPQNAVLRFLKGPGVRRYGGSALIAVVAFAVFVAAGYLVPLKWTGFPGTTLWNWLGLLLLPAAVASAKFFPRMLRSLCRRQRLMIAAFAAVWGLTIVGGYVWNWTWTGYQGNTLWDWLQLLLLPLLVPTVLMTAALNWIADNAPGTTETPGVSRRAAEMHTPAT